MPTPFEINIEYIVYSDPAKTFEAFTDPGIIGAWGGGLSVVEPKEGGIFQMFDGWVKGKITAYEPAQKLGYTWKPEEWDKKTPASEVMITFAKHKAGTMVTLRHWGFPSEEESSKHENGWIDYVLDLINDYFIPEQE